MNEHSDMNNVRILAAAALMSSGIMLCAASVSAHYDGTCHSHDDSACHDYSKPRAAGGLALYIVIPGEPAGKLTNRRLRGAQKKRTPPFRVRKKRAR